MILYHLMWSAGMYSDHYEDYLGCYSSDEKRKEAIERFRAMMMEEPDYDSDDDDAVRLVKRFHESENEKDDYRYDRGNFVKFDTSLDEDIKYD